MSTRQTGQDLGVEQHFDAVVLTPGETKQVSGGNAGATKKSSGPGPAPYNTPGNPEYGAT
jgi:hypothetical protein